MDWWDAEFSRRLAAGGRLVMEYDHRDAGRSVSHPPGVSATPARPCRRCGGLIDALAGAVCIHVNQLRLVTATRGTAMRVISAQGLKQKLDRGDSFKLVNALGNWEYQAAHIPGSLHFSSPEEILRELGRDDEIVVHCSNPSCRASVALYQFLERNGYRNLRRFAGGLQEWQEAGYPLEGTMVEGQDDEPRT
jgi:rhodanese-related sulfurtransferase